MLVFFILVLSCSYLILMNLSFATSLIIYISQCAILKLLWTQWSVGYYYSLWSCSLWYHQDQYITIFSTFWIYVRTYVWCHIKNFIACSNNDNQKIMITLKEYELLLKIGSRRKWRIVTWANSWVPVVFRPIRYYRLWSIMIFILWLFLSFWTLYSLHTGTYRYVH